MDNDVDILDMKGFLSDDCLMIVDFPLVSESNLLDMFQAPQNQTKYVLTQVFMLECVPRIPVSKTNAPEASNSLPGGRTRTAFFRQKKALYHD